MHKDQIKMSGVKGIRQTSSTYDIYPIDEMEESQEHFIPYGRPKYAFGDQIDQFNDRTINTQLSHSLHLHENRAKQNILKIRRCKTITKGPQSMIAKTASLTINGNHTHHPEGIHTTKSKAREGGQRKLGVRNRLIRLQGEMRRNKPLFFNERDQFLPTLKKAVHIPKLDLLSYESVCLGESGSKEEVRVPISRKEVKQMVLVKKIGQNNAPPQMKRKNTASS